MLGALLKHILKQCLMNAIDSDSTIRATLRSAGKREREGFWLWVQMKLKQCDGCSISRRCLVLESLEFTLWTLNYLIYQADRCLCTRYLSFDHAQFNILKQAVPRMRVLRRHWGIIIRSTQQQRKHENIKPMDNTWLCSSGSGVSILWRLEVLVYYYSLLLIHRLHIMGIGMERPSLSEQKSSYHHDRAQCIFISKAQKERHRKRTQ